MDLKQGYPVPPAGARKRFCRSLMLNPQTVELYRHWHDPAIIWKEIPEGIRRAGITSMEIYLAGDRAVMFIEGEPGFDLDTAFGKLSGYERQAEWEALVARFQDADPGLTSAGKWLPCERIFSLDECT